tara:strand:+ start:1457 stop:1858 length:402 start_codon:yes stop_codon:yes gene_type:complete
LTKVPKIQVELRDGKLMPVSQHDAERLSDCKSRQLFNLSLTGTRSNPHHNLYWSILKTACESTGMWPTSKHLHHELKLVCGYYKTTISPLTLSIVRHVDSTDFSAMTQAEFMIYFELAMSKLSEAVGYDPITR